MRPFTGGQNSVKTGETAAVLNRRRHAVEVASLRRHGACELHRICADFVSSVNSNLSEAALDLSPATYAPEWFREPGENLLQIGSQGRQMQIAFAAPSEAGLY